MDTQVESIINSLCAQITQLQTENNKLKEDAKHWENAYNVLREEWIYLGKIITENHGKICLF